MTRRPPLISVSMPVFNAERYISQAVESILDQTLGDFEFLIVDDGSSDGTAAILTRYANQDQRIRLSIRSNKGVVATLNELVDQACGELIARMDSDDISLPERLERQAAYLHGNPDCVAVGSQAQIIDPDGDPLGIWFQSTAHEEIDAQNLRGDHQSALCHPAVMMRRQVVLDVGKYREEFRFCEDLDLWLRLAEHGRLANLPLVLLKYRTHKTNQSNLRVTRAAEDFQQILTEARFRRGLPIDRLPLGPHPSYGSVSQSIYDKWGWQALTAGHVGTARKHAGRRLLEAPFSPSAWRLLYCALRGH
jgi:GT2 family glycosyltransferase